MDLRRRTGELNDFLRGARLERVNCNLCASADSSVLARRDGLGLDVTTVLCEACGLIYLNPRFSRDWYQKYYLRMDRLRRAYKHGARSEKEDSGAGFEDARRHGRALALRLKEYLKSGLTIDVGSAEGGLLAGMREVLAIEPIGIEPTLSRAEFATARGIPTYSALIEEISRVAPNLPLARQIVSTKSVNHFLDPHFFFAWAHRRLLPGGRLILEVKNFRQQARMSGRIEFGIQIDHPYMFTPETLIAFVCAAGFEILFLEVDEEKSRAERIRQKRSGLPIGHIRLAAGKTGRIPFADPVDPDPGRVRRLKRQLSPFALRLHYLTRYATPMKNILNKIGLAS